MSSERLTLPLTLYEQMWRGFLPETYFLKKELIPEFHSAYLKTYIERDVRQLADVSDLQLFSRFFRLCGALTAQEMNHSQLGRELGVTPQTASRWIDLLTATFQWVEIPAYSGNTIKRVSEKPKGYLADIGLACFSLAISTPQAVGSHPAWGNLFETLVVNEVRKQMNTLEVKPNVYHWRSHGGAEVDLLLERDGRFFPIEIKGKSHPTRRDIAGITAFRKTYSKLSIPSGLVIAPASSSYPVSASDWVIPWDIHEN